MSTKREASFAGRPTVARTKMVVRAPVAGSPAAPRLEMDAVTLEIKHRHSAAVIS